MAQIKERPREIDEDTTEDTGKREISKVKYDGSKVEIHHYWTDGKKDSATMPVFYKSKARAKNKLQKMSRKANR